MKLKSAITLLSIVLISSAAKPKGNLSKPPQLKLAGTWRLIKGAITENNKTTVTDYTKNIVFIKMLNDSHFAFMQHDVNKGKDSSAIYVSGGGSYSIKDSVYTEHLEYCSAREWEGNDFTFTVKMVKDTLVQSGIEKLPGSSATRVNVEKYVRLK